MRFVISNTKIDLWTHAGRVIIYPKTSANVDFILSLDWLVIHFDDRITVTKMGL